MANLNQTPSANRVHIAFFGRRNAGKSSVVNAVTGQALSIVSDVKGTTTDPVQKAMELLPLGPVVIIDTPGIDDEGDVGMLRVQRARQVLNKTDVAVLVVDGSIGKTAEDEALCALFAKKGVPYITVYNKSDLTAVQTLGENEMAVSALTGEHIHELKEKIAALAKDGENHKVILGDLLEPGDHVVLVTPIDSSAPKGRMILPQVQAIRDILDAQATCAVTQVEELPGVLAGLKTPPKLVVTDSQAFGKVKRIVPESVPLTSFSILFARYKGVLETAVRGAAALERLGDGDRILISEGCTHHRQCEDIGTVKLPGWIRQHTGKTFDFAFTSGGAFPEDLTPYALVVHCGGCMLNEREMQYRQSLAEESGVPYTNYGILIAYMNGILKRSLEPFAEYDGLL
ncbi:MAG: [FeFe] hydrogenase H-cluster maturation GTPase HydF [Hominenteromicrobium sp.]